MRARIRASAPPTWSRSSRCAPRTCRSASRRRSGSRSRVAAELRIPVFLYEDAARIPEHRNLASFRGKGFEEMREVIGSEPAKTPDEGAARVHPTAGAIAIGARFPLIAFNVNLDSRRPRPGEAHRRRDPRARRRHEVRQGHRPGARGRRCAGLDEPHRLPGDVHGGRRRRHRGTGRGRLASPSARARSSGCCPRTRWCGWRSRRCTRRASVATRSWRPRCWTRCCDGRGPSRVTAAASSSRASA